MEKYRPAPLARPPACHRSPPPPHRSNEVDLSEASPRTHDHFGTDPGCQENARYEETIHMVYETETMDDRR
ncbi:hypothetical protein NECAME_08063 [Necator americanus]|uniref:Uncharacterized protein n=1 Tax=Necator americanus TaxID=51031 RepID=W2TJH1_NECAM|nr:hypothetical protein NECAME_08063 [Necator americanus]ETN82240.1 hypothetical protein NECAME_08063 [Necator americanus]